MLTAALAVLTVLAASSAPAADPAPIVAAERAFAESSKTLGVKGSFLATMADDAVMLTTGPVDARAEVSSWPDEAPGAPAPFTWWPAFAGIAASGELGFTTGPVEQIADKARTLHYFTVWKKQADGSWRWVYDGGVAVPGAGLPGPEAAPVLLPPAPVAGSTPEAAVAEVQAAEAALAAAAVTGQAAAHLTALAPDGRLHIQQAPPAIGPEAARAALAQWPATFAFAPLFAESSKAGDLVWTYGSASWTREGQARTGHYVRVWQKRADGWRLVFAQLVPAPQPR